MVNTDPVQSGGGFTVIKPQDRQMLFSCIVPSQVFVTWQIVARDDVLTNTILMVQSL